MMKEGQSVMIPLRVLLAAWMYVVVAASTRLELHEGDKCKEINGTQWLCKKIKDCSTVTEEDLKERREKLQFCNSKELNDIVCCESESKTPPFGKKAKEMCKKYAELMTINIPFEWDEKYDNCYLYEPAVIIGSGGDSAHQREFPHMALIGYGNASSIDWWCGGSLISDRYVLSAAHCSTSSKGKARWARLGEYNFLTTADEKNGFSKTVDFEIIEIINHPNYSSSSYYNDITLFKLNTTVVFDDFMRPLCLHTEYEIPEGDYLATGWGITEWGGRQSDILQKMKLLISSSSECQEAYKDLIGDNLKDGIHDESMMCAGDVDKGIETCKGDSGGPLQVRLSKGYCMYHQFGVISFGSLCAGNRPGVYTRVSHYIPWIESVVWP